MKLEIRRSGLLEKPFISEELHRMKYRLDSSRGHELFGNA